MSGEPQKEADPQASSVPQHQPASGDVQTAVPTQAPLAKPQRPPGGIAYPHIVLAAVMVLISGILVAAHFQAVLEDAKFRGVLVSAGMHKQLRSLVPRANGDAAG